MGHDFELTTTSFPSPALTGPARTSNNAIALFRSRQGCAANSMDEPSFWQSQRRTADGIVVAVAATLGRVASEGNGQDTHVDASHDFRANIARDDGDEQQERDDGIRPSESVAVVDRHRTGGFTDSTETPQVHKLLMVPFA